MSTIVQSTISDTVNNAISNAFTTSLNAAITNSVNEAINDVLKEIKGQINDINIAAQKVKAFVEGSSHTLVQNVQTHKNEISSMVQQSSSWSSYGIFILFQIFFAFAFIWYKKMRDDHKKIRWQ
eukprot:TRINITY_DN2335_c0_g1_i1.p1 TRINITY_DN2335_c0_g1~~TRINITY_DN2335_c0_g1_i1.p1  ORF type:complete len:124 (-),score=11.89 TRINITY_DN2335_c0_g1_i1:47-418(-)